MFDLNAILEKGWVFSFEPGKTYVFWMENPGNIRVLDTFSWKNDIKTLWSPWLSPPLQESMSDSSLFKT